MAVINASAADFVAFSESENQVTLPTDCVDIIIFVDEAYTPSKDVRTEDSIVFSESPHEKDIDAEAADTLALWDSASRGATASAFDLFGVVDIAGMFHGGTGPDQLTFAETTVVSVTKPGTDVFTITESASGRLVPTADIDETVSFYDTALGIVDSCAPVDQRQAITLYSPADNPTTTLVLDSPDIGDTRTYEMQRINRRSRNNDLIVYRDPTWVKGTTLTYRFNHLNAQQRDNLLNFLEFTTGQFILLRDYEGNLWKGFIMNPNTVIAQIGTYKHQCELQFSGEIIGG